MSVGLRWNGGVRKTHEEFLYRNVERTRGRGVTDQVEAHDCVEIFRAAPDGILVIDANGKIVGANPQACYLFGYGADELQGLEIDALVPDRFRAAHSAHRAGYGDDPHARPMGIGLELLGLRSDGQEVPVEISLSPLSSPGGDRVICTVRDVTELRRYREFGRAALRAAEEERKRLALELHDDMAQRLAALLLRVRLASETETPRRREALLAELREELVDTAAALHRIARGLRPPALAEAGLEAAIRADVRSRLADTDLDVALDLDSVGESLDEDQKLVIYRILQEAISNVVRHADASRLSIALVRDGDRVLAEVEDDGRGFVVEEVDVLAGRLGILGMRERAASVGAKMSIRSDLGEGTRLDVEMSLREEPGKEDGRLREEAEDA
jgi:PAS domain S-box-containing protein